MINYNALIEGQKYWIITKQEYSFSIGEAEYNALQPYFYKCKEKTAHHETVFCFYKNNKEHIAIIKSDLHFCVFETKDDFLIHMVGYIELLNLVAHRLKKSNEFKNSCESYTFDNFFKQKIKESQQINPEKWI